MRFTLFFFILIFLLSACVEDPDVHSWELDVTVNFDKSISAEQLHGSEINLFNEQNGISIQETLDGSGHVLFENQESGFYTVSISNSFKIEEKLYFLNGYKKIELFNSRKDTVTVFMDESSAFIIKEIYYSGCLTPAGKSYFSDQFIEIVNNTNRVQYAGGLSIVEHESYAEGDNYWKHIDDSIVVKTIWTIPGAESEVPVQPGEGLVIAMDGMDHKDDVNGNPQSPVNLGSAAFEFFVSWDTNKDIDAPEVPNMEEDFYVYRANDFTMFSRGGSAMALVRLSGSNQIERKEFINNNLTPKKTSSGNYKYFCKIANSAVLDAVEVVRDELHAQYKRFSPELDAGFTFVTDGSKSGKSIRRKVQSSVNGVVRFQDTNNSSEDFEKGVDPNPGIIE